MHDTTDHDASSNQLDRKKNVHRLPCVRRTKYVLPIFASKYRKKLHKLPCAKCYACLVLSESIASLCKCCMCMYVAIYYDSSPPVHLGIQACRCCKSSCLNRRGLHADREEDTQRERAGTGTETVRGRRARGSNADIKDKQMEHRDKRQAETNRERQHVKNKSIYHITRINMVMDFGRVSSSRHDTHTHTKIP